MDGRRAARPALSPLEPVQIPACRWTGTETEKGPLKPRACASTPGKDALVSYFQEEKEDLGKGSFLRMPKRESICADAFTEGNKPELFK